MPSLASSFERAAPLAPATLAELMRWPSHNMMLLAAKEGMATQFKQWLQLGVFMTTAYSGIGAPEIAARAAQGAAVSHGVIAAADMGFVFVEALDSKPAAQAVLSSHGPQYAARHVFGDLNDRISAEVKGVLDSMEAADKATPEQKEQAFMDMQSFLLYAEEQGALRKRDRRRYCLRHKKKRLLHDVGVALEGGDRSVGGDEPPLRLLCAGLTCKDYSTRKRSRLGSFGPSGRPLLLWAMERRAHVEDVVIVENVALFDIKVLEGLLSERYTFHQFLVGPEDLGWWVSRRRLYIVMIKRGVGLSFSGSSPDFFATFAKARPLGFGCLRGQMFYSAPAKLVEQEQARRWERRFGPSAGGGRDADVGAGVDLSSRPWTEVLTSFQSARLQISEKQFLEKWAEVHCERYNPDTDAHVRKKLIELQNKYRAAFIVDLEQGEVHGNLRHNNMLPCLLSHGEYWSSGAGRPLLGQEFFLAQAFPIFGMHEESELPGFDRMVTSWGLTQTDLKDLGGNTMHLDVLNALLLFVLGNVSRPPSPVARSTGELGSSGPIACSGSGDVACHSGSASHDAPELPSPETPLPKRQHVNLASEEVSTRAST